MLDIAWSEMLVIMVVALVVIGPKDLPRLVREVGRWTSKARTMAREFQRSFDDMVREAELEDVRKGLDQVRPHNITKTIREAVDPEGDLDRAFDLEDSRPARATPLRDSAEQPVRGSPSGAPVTPELGAPAMIPEAVVPPPPEPVPAVQRPEAERAAAPVLTGVDSGRR